jgi:hypothetical protein
MKQSVAIIIAGGLIAAAIMFTNHWSLVVLHPDSPSDALRLNRWTGTVILCGGLREGTWEMPCPVADGVPQQR